MSLWCHKIFVTVFDVSLLFLFCLLAKSSTHNFVPGSSPGKISFPQANGCTLGHKFCCRYFTEFRCQKLMFTNNCLSLQQRNFSCVFPHPAGCVFSVPRGAFRLEPRQICTDYNGNWYSPFNKLWHKKLCKLWLVCYCAISFVSRPTWLFTGLVVALRHMHLDLGVSSIADVKDNGPISFACC